MRRRDQKPLKNQPTLPNFVAKNSKFSCSMFLDVRKGLFEETHQHNFFRSKEKMFR